MLININYYRYQKFAKVSGDIIKNETSINYIGIHTTNRQNFRKEYVKAYMKLLSK